MRERTAWGMECYINLTISTASTTNGAAAAIITVIIISVNLKCFERSRM